jgi:hypothetical protein
MRAPLTLRYLLLFTLLSTGVEILVGCLNVRTLQQVALETTGLSELARAGRHSQRF